jgi:LytS/YehU family sensor histidine kinase
MALWGWFLFFNVGLAYLNIYFFSLLFLSRPRYVAYGACIVGCLALMTLSVALSAYLLDRFYQSGQFLNALQSPRIIIPLSFACPMAVVLYNRQLTHRKRIHQLENVTMQSELEQLKKQINPHFLFNMLNNTMVLLKTDTLEASQALLKFKDLLNYQWTVSSADKTLLTNDIQFLNDFLNLEKIRRDRFEFDIAVEGDTNGIYVPPFLFIPFVENAVKHNPESDEYLSYISIQFRPDNGRLHFTCINSKPSLPQSTEQKDGGLGLVNVRRRLELLYPKKHSLLIESLSNSFKIDLQIPIHNNL